MEILVLCIAFGASIVGAICGIGGGYQEVCLALVTAATLVYTLNKKRVKTMQVRSPLVCIAACSALWLPKA